jgi:hypothetical protein
MIMPVILDRLIIACFVALFLLLIAHRVFAFDGSH